MAHQLRNEKFKNKWCRSWGRKTANLTNSVRGKKRMVIDLISMIDIGRRCVTNHRTWTVLEQSLYRSIAETCQRAMQDEVAERRRQWADDEGWDESGHVIKVVPCPDRDGIEDWRWRWTNTVMEDKCRGRMGRSVEMRKCGNAEMRWECAEMTYEVFYYCNDAFAGMIRRAFPITAR